MDDLENLFNELLLKLDKKCPIFKPSICPQQYSLNSLNDLLSNSNDMSGGEYFDKIMANIPFILFSTSVSYISRVITITDIKVSYL